jgi:ABC-2 type transport system permease protein
MTGQVGTQVVGVETFHAGHVIERLAQDVRALELFAGRTEALRDRRTAFSGPRKIYIKELMQAIALADRLLITKRDLVNNIDALELRLSRLNPGARIESVMHGEIDPAQLFGAGLMLSTKRDLGAGLRPPRRGKAHASALLQHPIGFAFRLHRAALIGWAAGMFLLGTSYGSVMGDVEGMMGDIDAIQEMLAAVGGATPTESFMSMVTTVLAVAASLYVVLATKKMRSEESAGRAEPVLATAIDRRYWAVTHVIAAAVGGVIMLRAAGGGIGTSAAASLGDDEVFGQLVGAALSYAPAQWVVIGLVALLFGLAPRLVHLGWVLVGYSFVVLYFGGLLDLPDWMANLSPFGHVAQMPVQDFNAVPLVWLTGLAVGLCVAGLVAFQRRDLQSPS